VVRQFEPVLNGSVLVLFSSEKNLSVRFSVLKKWGENWTELNFGNTTTLTLGMRRHPHWLVKHSACIVVVDSKTRCWIICVAAIAILASASWSPAALLVMGVHLGIGSRRHLGHHVQCWAKYYFTLAGQMCTGECAVGGK